MISLLDSTSLLDSIESSFLSPAHHPFVGLDSIESCDFKGFTPPPHSH
ncbi:hypothetical protein [Helicobacter saguini]|nr:hypothetical protein [Helicobacter saguini]